MRYQTGLEYAEICPAAFERQPKDLVVCYLLLSSLSNRVWLFPILTFFFFLSTCKQRKGKADNKADKDFKKYNNVVAVIVGAPAALAVAPAVVPP